MTNINLAGSYVAKAASRLKALNVLFSDGDYSDVVREAQEIVELAAKAMLRRVGIDPPKWHDVGGIILENRERFPAAFQEKLPRIAEISKRLRRDRELSFYGDIDFIPSEEFSEDDAKTAVADAAFVVESARQIVGVTEIPAR